MGKPGVFFKCTCIPLLVTSNMIFHLPWSNITWAPAGGEMLDLGSWRDGRSSSCCWDSPPCAPWVSIGKLSLMVWSSLLQLHMETWLHLSACHSSDDGRFSVAHTTENIYSQFRSGEKLISANEALWFIHPNTSSCRGIIVAGKIWLIQCKVLPNGRMKLIGCCATDSRDNEKKNVPLVIEIQHLMEWCVRGV